ncbi:MAG: hypothetical protein ACFB4I_05775 [Cyanophyceae cyanobacterium]
MKLHYLVAASLFLLGGSQAPLRRELDPKALSGNISLTLEQGVWKLWEEEPVYQDITLDLVCQDGRCESEAWGYAPRFNKEVDHRGTVEVVETDQSWQLRAEMEIQFHPWEKETETATYTINLIPFQEQLIGSYTGEFNDRSVQGKVRGTISPRWPQPIPTHQPVEPQEHPRLIFRKSQLPDLRAKAQTPAGRAIVEQLKQALTHPIYYDGFVPTGGYHAAGHCFLSLLEEDPQPAQTAWQITEKSMENSAERLLEQSPIVAGVALAYDLCYDAWSEERRQQVTRWLATQAIWLARGDSPKRGWNSNAWSNWNARARGAAGLAALAILHEPEAGLRAAEPLPLLKLAERNVKRYLQTALGDRGFGTEGDHYSAEPWRLTIIPFLQGYQNVMGQDLVTGSSAEWFLPHYITRTVEADEISTYGRHYLGPGASLYAVGLGLVPQRFLPGVMWFFERHFGLSGDSSFGIDPNFPHLAAYVLAGYPDTTPQNPTAEWDRVLVDEEKGFYVFRDRWQDSQDFVASIYSLRERLPGSWSFPDVGSFRIRGLGEHWAKGGTGEGDWHQENVVFMPNVEPWQSAQPIFFESDADGSGIVSLQTKPIVSSQAENSVGIQSLRSFATDYSGASGAPGLFVVVDRFTGDVNAAEFSNKTWRMHTEGQVTIDGQSFTIQSPSGATMKGTFVVPLGVQISHEQGAISATGGNHFFVVMTVQQGSAPEVKMTGIGLQSEVTVGDQTITFKDNRIVLGR